MQISPTDGLKKVVDLLMEVKNRDKQYHKVELPETPLDLRNAAANLREMKQMKE